MTGHVVDGLYEDHDIILEALNLLDKAVSLVEQGKLDASIVGRLLEFLSRFADAYHHGKEELLLFPRLEKQGVPLHGGPIGVMVCEHGMGRYMLRNARIAVERVSMGNRDAIGDLKYYANAYRDLLVQHIDKENNVLFPMARQVIGEGELIEEAEKVKQEHGYNELLEEYRRLKDSIERS